jgi:hypothetical protein
MAKGDAVAADKSAGTVSDSSNAVQVSSDAGSKLSVEANSVRTAYSLPVSSGLGDVQIVNNPTASAVAAPVDNTPFDKSKTMTQLIETGAIKRSDVPAPVNTEIAKPGTQAQVTVTYADVAANDPTKAPDIIVRKDGTIEATGDFEAAQKKNVVVQVERTPGDTSDPNDAQKASIDKVVSYVYDRMAADPNVSQTGLRLNDEFGLISENLVKKLATNGDAGVEPTVAENRENFSPETQRTMSNMSRMSPGSSGSMSQGDIQRNFPTRDVPNLEGETPRVVNNKDVVAAMFNPDKAAPYETLRSRPNHGYEAGRYGISYPLMRNWFSGFGADLDELDEDGFMAMLGRLDKAGKLPKSFAKFKNKDGTFDKAAAGKFLNFAKGMKEGKGLTSADVKENMPGQMQEEIAMNLVDKFNKAGGDNVGKTALGFHLGKSPDQFTQAELDDKGNQDFMKSAERLATLNTAGKNMGANDRLDYNVSLDGNSLDAKIVNKAFNHARSVDTTGWCAREFQIAWAKEAPELMGSGDGVQMTRAFQRSNNFTQVNWETAQEAARQGKAVAVTRRWASGADHGGHVATLAFQNGRIVEASDHVTNFNKDNPRYRKSDDKFFIFTGNA